MNDEFINSGPSILLSGSIFEGYLCSFNVLLYRILYCYHKTNQVLVTLYLSKGNVPGVAF